MRPLQTVRVSSRSQALILMGNFNHPDTCRRDNMAIHRQLRRFHECVNYNFLTQVTEESTRRDAMLDPVLINREELELLQGKFGCSGQEIKQFKILRAVRRAHGHEGCRLWPPQGSSW